MKIFNKSYLLGFITCFILLSIVGVYASITLLASNITYSNSKTSATNVNDALNELYENTPSPKYKESILNGADPVLPDDLIPVTIANNGTVTYANTSSEWYNYENKTWANAIRLIYNPSKKYSVGDAISESDISAYFVWIPRYKY